MRRILDDVNIIGGLSISGSASISVGIVYNSSTQSTTAFVSDKDYYIGVGDNVNLSNASAFSLVRFGATGTMVMASSDSNYNTFLTQTSNQFFLTSDFNEKGAGFAGGQYADDYSTYFTDRSWIDKGFADKNYKSLILLGKITLETNRTDDQQITLPAGAIITDIVLDNPSEPLGKTYFLTVSSVTGTPTIGNSVEGDISGSSGVITGITGSILNVTTTEGVSPFQNSESITIQGGSTAVVDSFTTNTPCETLELWKSVSRSGSNNQIAFSGGYSLQYILFPDDYLSFFSGVRTGELSFFRKTGTASYLSFSQASDFAATVDISIYGYPTTAHL